MAIAHCPLQNHPPAICVPQEPDWEQLADEAVQNADLDMAVFLPWPLEVITIDNKDDYPVITILPATSHRPIIPKVEPDGPLPSIPPSPPTLALSHYPTCSRQAPQHLNEYHPV